MKLYIKRLPILVMTILFLLFHSATWIWLYSNILPQSDPIFLHYNTLFGVDLVGPWWKIIYVPLSGLFIFVINFFIGWYLFQKDHFSAYLLVGVATLCQLLLFISSFLLVFLNV